MSPRRARRPRAREEGDGQDPEVTRYDAAALTAPGTAVATERISIGTGGTGGVFYVVGAGIADLIDRYLEDVTARVEVTGASVENIRRVAAGRIQIGFSSASTLYEALRGTGPFADGPRPVAAIALLHPAVLQSATVAESGIAHIEDPAGRRVSLGPPGSNSAVMAQRLLEACGFFGAVDVEFLSCVESVEAMPNGSIEAAFVLAGAPTAALVDPAARREIRLLPVDPARIRTLLERYPYDRIGEIPANTYPGQTLPVAALVDPALLFTHRDANPDPIYRMTKTIFEHLDELAKVHPQARAISLATAPDTPIPLHPEAERYFREATAKETGGR